MGLEALERHGAEESRRDDAIGVDVVAAQGHRPAGDARDGPIAHDRPPGLAASAGGEDTIGRTSTTSPATAAAATIAGLISSVRPVGLPIRPLKLRLEEEAHTWRSTSRSGFMARHIEHPASLHSKPAS